MPAGFYIAGKAYDDNALPTTIEPLPPLPWPNIPAMKKIAVERGIPERFSSLGITRLVDQVKKNGWSQEQLESFLQNGATSQPSDPALRDKGPFPILPHFHVYDAVEFEKQLDIVEVEVKIAVRELRNGNRAGYDAHAAAGKAAAKKMDELATPDPATPLNVRVTNPREMKAYSRGIYNAFVLAETADDTYRINLMRDAAGGTIGLRSPNVHQTDDDYDFYTPFIDPFTYG